MPDIPPGIDRQVTLSNVDWDLLHLQKMILIQLLAKQRDPSIQVSQKQLSELDGLVNLIDYLCEQAEDRGMWRHPLGPRTSVSVQ